MNTDKWDKRYLQIAKQVSAWSKEKRSSRKVGAVLVRDNRIIATGFNGFPTGVTDTPERLENKELKQDLVVHAEMNALIVAGSNAKGATLYVYGKPVCARCAASIIQAGITRVVSPKPLTEIEVQAKKLAEKECREKAAGYIDWEKSGRTAREMFEETNVAFNSYPRTPSPMDDAANSAVRKLKAKLNSASQQKAKLKIGE